MEHRWNDPGKGNPKYSEENLTYRRFVHHQGFFLYLFHILIFFFHPICKKCLALGQWLNRDLRGERPATNRLNHGTASFMLPIQVFYWLLVAEVTAFSSKSNRKIYNNNSPSDCL